MKRKLIYHSCFDDILIWDYANFDEIIRHNGDRYYSFDLLIE